ncbi:hypothetical protein PIB30_093567 [Stylosanthes scabra]|uniref:Uncharacterized protein n=1 Tax=Stylosanthes scabra TaxID=79078 RepID=A0ABU6SWQ2_9FABA|nr:hypothetical protein [Stylosanthes scabra]
MRKNQEGRIVASGVASRLHKHQQKLPTQQKSCPRRKWSCTRSFLAPAKLLAQEMMVHTNSEPVVRAAAGRLSNGTVAGELKTCALVHSLSFQMDGNSAFMNGQGWDPSQIGYHSDNSSDGYFSCEDSLSACQIDNDEFQHQARFEEMFEAFVQERAEILDNQKRLEAQLMTIAELTSSVIRRSAPLVPPCQEEGLGAITLCLGTQLKEPTDENPNSDSITSEERNLQRNVKHKENLPTTEQETTSGYNERVVDPNLNSLPFPSAAKKMRK